jgi:Uma2 family endonuclease
MAMYKRVRVSAVYETETPPAPRTDLGPYRRAEYLALPDEPRCELVYGRLLVMTAPTLRHQEVVGRVFHLLLDFADRTGGRAFVSPVDVVLADHSIVQPDIVYVGPARTSILGAPRVEGAPDLTG